MADIPAEASAVITFLASPTTLTVVNFLTFIILLLTVAVHLKRRHQLPEQHRCSCKEQLDSYKRDLDWMLNLSDRQQRYIEQLIARDWREFPVGYGK